MILTASLFLSTSLSADGANIKIDLRRVPPGWVADKSGYFMDETTMVEFASAAFTYEAELKAWETAYWELDSKFASFIASSDLRIKSLDDHINILDMQYDQSKAEWEKRESQLEKALTKAKRRASLPGLGLFAGYGGNGGNFGFTVGVGLVWRVGP